MKCPRCGRENLETSPSCGCGYDFQAWNSRGRSLVLGILSTLSVMALAMLALALVPDAAIQNRLILIDIDRTTHPVSSRSVWLGKAALVASSVACMVALALVAGYFERAIRLALYLLEDALAFAGQVRAEFRHLRASVSRWEAACLAALVVLGTALRVDLLLLPVSSDESHTYVLFASRTVLDVLSDYTMPNNHILHTLLAHFSTQGLGLSPATLRLAAMLAGLSAIPMSYWLMHRLFDAHTALLSAGLVAVGPPMVEFSARARGYTLVALFFLAGFVVATHLRARSSKTGWVLLTILFTLGMYTIPTMLFGFFIVATWMLVTCEKGRHRATLLRLGLTAGAIAGCSVLLYLVPILRTGLPELPQGSLTEFPGRLLGRLQETLACWTGDLPLPLQGLFGLSVIAALLSLRKERQTAWILVSVVAGSLLPMVAQGVIPPQRVFSFLFPIFAGLIAFGASRAFRMLWQPRHDRLQKLLWVGIVLLVCGSWSHARLDAFWNQTRLPGTHRIRHCVPGYFVDAEAIVQRFEARPASVDVLAAYTHSGIVESLRFYMMKSGLPPTLVLSFHGNRGHRQLLPYRGLFMVMRSSESSIGGEMGPLWGFSERDFDRTFQPPALVGRYVVSDLYQLEPRKAPQRPPSAKKLRSNVRYRW